MQTVTILSIWGLEYSFNQNSFYAAPLSEIINKNIQSVQFGEQHDFILIGIYDSKEKIELIIDSWIKKLNSKIIYNDIYNNLIVKPK